MDKRTLPGYTPYSYMPPYMYPYQLTPFYTGVYGRNYSTPPIYSSHPLPLPVRPEVPTCSWTAESAQVKNEHRDENVVG